MTTGKALNGKPYAGNPHVRFDEGEVASAATPRRGSLLYKARAFVMVAALSCTAAAFCGLEEGFVSPPDSAKPHTMYLMMNGNVSKEGITDDFEALAKAGVGGVLIFDVGCYIPPGELSFNTPAWFDVMKHVHNEAKRLGLEVCIVNCSGWANLGGPWVKPKDAMKVTTFTETRFKGPGKFSGVLPRTKKDNGFYEDIAVLAYPTPRRGAALSDFASKAGHARRIQKKRPLISRSHAEFDDSEDPKPEGIKLDTKEFKANQVVDKRTIIDLTSRMDAGGKLEWDAPPGNWTILRMGFVCNGRKIHPSSKHGAGLEVDKLSSEAIERHFNGYVGRLCDELGISANADHSTGINGIHVDSWEADCQNWTQGLDKMFKSRKGYDITPYLPVLAKRIVGSVDESERFLEDFRRVIADLFAERYASRFAGLCHQRGVYFSLEPYGTSNADDLQYGRRADIPMAEFWSNTSLGVHGMAGTGNTRMAAHLAHVWGRRVAAAEAFTENPQTAGRWLTTPFDIKSQCDRVYAAGINRIVYHRFVHQPWKRGRYLPGMTMGRWGMHFDRTQTWWHIVPEFTKYQSRCQWMLQEGRFVADILYWCGEEAPNTGLASVTPPGGYDYDICDTEAVKSLKVKDGKVVAPGGVEYRMLVLPSRPTMSERMVRLAGELAAAGAKVVAPKRPTRSPGLGTARRDGGIAPYQTLVDSAWSKGVMECGVAEALDRLGVERDVVSADVKIDWIHRRDASADWYFIACDNETNVNFEVSLRTAGRTPEIWDAETGERRPAAVWRVQGVRTFVTLDFKESGSAFVVFRDTADKPHSASLDVKAAGAQPVVSAVDGVWSVDFPVEWYSGGNAHKLVELTRLESWTRSADPDVKYFSGTATYRKCVEIAAPHDGERIMLDLGEVRNFAEVTVNGKAYAPLWRPPFRIDITDAVGGPRFRAAKVIADAQKRVPPVLDLEIKVTNLWPNRLIGDDVLFPRDCVWLSIPRGELIEYGIKEIPAWVKAGKPSPTGRHTFTTWRHWTKHDELLPSGLLGPVVIRYGILAK